MSEKTESTLSTDQQQQQQQQQQPQSNQPSPPAVVEPPKSYQEWLAEIDLEADDVNADKDKLLEKSKNILKLFNGENDPQILWRVARNAYKAATVAEANGLKDKEKELLREAEEYILMTLKADNQNAKFHAWAAYIAGKLSNFCGQKERIERGHLMRHHLEEAIKLKTDDAGVYFSYGRWCLEVAKLSWVERKLAAALFSDPPKASYEDALAKFKEADKLKPDWKANFFFMGKTFIAMKNYKKAIESLDLAMKCTPKDEEDLTVQNELTTLRKKYESYR